MKTEKMKVLLYLKKSGLDKSGKAPIIPNRSLEKASCHFLMTAIRKTALYMLDP